MTLEEKLKDLRKKKTSQKVEQAKCDVLLDELNALNAKINDEEAEKKNVEAILANKKELFPPWSLERIEDESLNKPKLYWLEPQTSFSVDNDVECQLDLPITVIAFQFRCFESIEKVPMGNTTINKKIFNFYLKHSKPQYESWNIKKIVGLKVRKSEKVDDLIKIHFKVVRGNNHEADEFTMVDLPLMNPFDWVSTLNIVSREPVKFR
ncbi:unnamed protein product [Lactuca virosa]|uniref:MATH domain-containing protein n=1 Tax=Lactuca virosa TaxID=75947 RepID=A0AAU9NHT6_9ASTR|nr:unnamed protein product [Lactuca virosa]